MPWAFLFFPPIKPLDLRPGKLYFYVEHIRPDFLVAEIGKKGPTLKVSKQSVRYPTQTVRPTRLAAAASCGGFRRLAIACLGLTLLLADASLICAGAQVGMKAATFRLVDDDGKTRSLEDFAGRVVVFEFWSFKCPPSAAYDERMAALDAKYRSRGVIILAVDSNKNEPAEEVRLNRVNRNLPFPVLMDQDGTLAESLGATHTPSVVILDGKGIIRYRGAIDNNKRAGERDRIAYTDDALDAVLSDRPVPQAETKLSGGCSIRR